MTAPLAREKLWLIHIYPEIGGGTDRAEAPLLCSKPEATHVLTKHTCKAVAIATA
jgi:hypothetical protein